MSPNINAYQYLDDSSSSSISLSPLDRDGSLQVNQEYMSTGIIKGFVSRNHSSDKSLLILGYADNSCTRVPTPKDTYNIIEIGNLMLHNKLLNNNAFQFPEDTSSSSASADENYEEIEIG